VEASVEAARRISCTPVDEDAEMEKPSQRGESRQTREKAQESQSPMREHHAPSHLAHPIGAGNVKTKPKKRGIVEAPLLMET